jgi:hypothetical protein
MTYSSPKNDLLMTSLQNFYNIKENIDTLLPILNGDSKISLRVIDWFVTNYSKKFNISYLISDDNKLLFEDEDGNLNIENTKFRQFVVYIDYKLQLKGYQKKQFDPFCRRSRIDFYYNTENSIVTTIGQLNFFKWAISNRIIEFIEKNLKVIETDMNTCYKAVYNVSKDKKATLKSESSIYSDNSVNSSPVNNNSENALFPNNSSMPNLVDDENNLNSKSRRKRHQLSVSATKTLSKTNVKVVLSFD